ncbi:hypothetical protein R70723_20075 [Paenibacillus sp. FSL R7-0273]|uniref:hypothetical protein n=1 Tax=Paenibacillus sp. FSL R7-0273 TaxID=1536772 RepID=UPI0004F766A6|nr:hypothetical protein [Paenibacillus sp. FSL R7-0273]AIQ47944.1 hypothetical protein R70723_20075 [Paenibacillus sp. FSL R7-0273]OMF94505.1 hypothetical protein BK144_08225 [Paenibacillus sp. FSL R7-0273]
MKKKIIYIISFIVLVTLIIVMILPKREIVSVSLVSDTATITYTDAESLEIIGDAIRTVKKVPGAVDVGPPSYRMTVTYDDSDAVQYSVYMDFETKNGFLIKDSNSERMLDLRKKNSEELADLLAK